MDVIDLEFRDAVFKLDGKALVDAFNRSTDSAGEKRSAVDGCFKAKVVSVLSQTEDLIGDVSRLLDFCFEAASQECASKTIPVITLMDVFESTTIDKCEQLFKCVEVKTFQWKSGGFLEACRTQLLRMCNDLLRRLSRTIDTEFCGRILIFLARCLPLTEKSGLNLTSQFNIDNVTKYDPLENDTELTAVGSTSTVSVDEPSQQKAIPMETTEVEEGETDVAGSSSVSVDYNLYVKFWQLQSFFSSPNNCYEKFGFRLFQHNTNEILNAFQLLKLDAPLINSTASPPTKRHKPDDNEMEDEQLAQVHRRRPTWADNMGFSSFSEEQQRSTYFAKYLTSQKLLHLQFNDNTFRRYILVQFLILFQYLTSDVKFKDKKTHVLNDEQTRWIDDCIKKCYDLLAETYPYGEKFSKVVQHILNREEHWNQWKNSGCDDFTQKADREKMLMFKRRQKPKLDDRKFDLGNATLTELWNVAPDNFEACKSAERKFVPDLETFLDPAIEQLDPEAGIEDKYKLVNDENFQWRALRLLSMKSPNFFQPATQQITSIGSFLTSSCEKIAEGIPKFKDLKMKSNVKDGGTSDDGKNDQTANQLQEQEIVRTDTNAEEEAEFRAQNFEGPGEQLVTPDQIESLSALIDSGWVKLAQELEMPDDSIAALRKKQIPAHACSVVLNQWCDSEGALATVKRLCNILLKAELFDEEVVAVLNTSPGAFASDTGRSIISQDEEIEVRPARVSSSVSARKSGSGTDGNRAATPVMDERRSTASNI